MTPTLRAGDAALTFPAAPGGFGVRLEISGTSFAQSAPLQLEVVDAGGQIVWLTGSYASVTVNARGCTATGAVSSAGGTRFEFTDVYRVEAREGAFSLAREVRVQSPVAADRGFATRWTLPSSRPLAMEECDFFVPGVWYRHNEHVPPGALASRLNDRDYFFREDRLPLPLAMLRDRGTGATLGLLHLDADPVSFAGEDGRERLVDARLQFGSPGFVNHEKSLGAAFWFPGTEGERTYVGGAAATNGRWAFRSHPVQSGVAHRYRLLLRLGRTPDYPTAVRQTWRAAWALYRPPVRKADLEKVYRDSMELLADVCRAYHGVVGLPFLLSMPDATIPENGALSGQMGFVGQQIPACALLLRYGLETGRRDVVDRAASIIDFWAENARAPSGALRTWYDIRPDGKRVWRDYKMFLRVTSDGVGGALQAWNVSRKHGQPRPQWLQFAQAYGDWLVAHQNADGGYFRAYDFDSSPLQRTTDTTDHPIRFLVDLYRATGRESYKSAALKAGEFCWRSVHQAYAYVGGTPDNPNVLDKEGGVMALEAFAALYDLTGERRWLDAATQAAEYVETWTYCWNIPMPTGDPKSDFPPGRTTHGLSLIATGHSGADNYLAGAPFAFYRLYLWTGDPHFRDYARFLLFDTKQLLDWDGRLGYAKPGLQLEAMSLAVRRGHSVKTWLPWLTVATLEPLVRLHDVFGSKNLDVIEKLPLRQRREANVRFGRTRGFNPSQK